jgi:hypothetical protein
MKTINDIMNYALQEEFCWQNNCDSITLETKEDGTQVIDAWSVDYNTEDATLIKEYTLSEVNEWLSLEYEKEAKLANADAFFGV